MAKYTIEFNYLLKDDSTKNKLNEILNNYPICKEEHREELNNKILKRYYFREIGVETAERFLFLLERKLEEIMPYYNQLFETCYVEFDPLQNVNITETYKSNIDSNTNSKNSGSATGVGEGLSVDSDTPNQEITEDEIIANKFASATNHNKANTKMENNNQGEVVGNRVEEWERKQSGTSAWYPTTKAIDHWRKILINVDTMILDDLNELFINIF